MESVKLNGVLTYAPKNKDELISYALNNHSILVAVNAEKILHATDQTRKIINKNVGYPDGIGAVWALNKKGFKNVVKIPGCELWLEIIRKFHKQKSFYLIGGKEEVINQTVMNLKNEFPKINIKGYRNGYIKTKEEIKKITDIIMQLKPDIVFVAMGSPKQEFFMELLKKSHSALYQGLGGSFDVYTGNVKRAPTWWVRNNLEWAYRLVKQPTRIVRQKHLLKFLFILFKNKF